MGEGEGLLAAIPSSPTPRDLRRRLPIRSLNPRPPAAAEEEEEGEAPGSSSAAAPARKEMERRTESNSSWNPPPPPPAASSRRMCVRRRREREEFGDRIEWGICGGFGDFPWLRVRRGSASFKTLGSGRCPLGKWRWTEMTLPARTDGNLGVQVTVGFKA